MNNTEKQELQKTAVKVRMGVIEGTYNAKSGHPGGSLSIADIVTYLYEKELRVDAENPDDPKRDRFVLSKGHCAPALYAILAEKGFFPKDEIKSLRHVGALLQGHPSVTIPGVDMSTGSLGQGVSAACGMAASAKLSGEDYRVYSILGDGEIEEGMVWEAAMFAGFRKLDNLLLIVDFNGLQIDGPIDEVCSPKPIDKKFEAFNFNVITIDAHDFDQIEKAVNDAKACKGKPTVIIQKSIKGKGVSFMENAAEWHGTAPNEEQYKQAMSELNAQYDSILQKDR